MTRMDDLVVVGAGPYGLSIAAHAAAAGLGVRVLGRPMASWRDHMPAGMYLKSEPWSSNLSAPAGRHTLADYCATRGLAAEHGSPLPIRTFSAYGLWFARHAAWSRGGGGHRHRGGPARRRLRGQDRGGAAAAHPYGRARRRGHAVREPPRGTARPAARSLLAQQRPPRPHPFRFYREVAVLGAGQAALETAALLAEAGARPCLVARRRMGWTGTPSPSRWSGP